MQLKLCGSQASTKRPDASRMGAVWPGALDTAQPECAPSRNARPSADGDDAMTKVFVFGCTGGVGSRLAQRLVAQRVHVVGLCRRPDQADALRKLGVEPALGDLTELNVPDLAKLMADCRVAVFAAGAPNPGAGAADRVDGEGLVLATDAAADADVRRFLHVSTFPDASRDRRMPAEFEHYIKVKRHADVHLASTDLDWVILRPGTLTNARGSGKVHLGTAIPHGDVPRDDVAAVLAGLLDKQDVSREILELTSGDTPVADAIANATRPARCAPDQWRLALPNTALPWAQR